MWTGAAAWVTPKGRTRDGLPYRRKWPGRTPGDGYSIVTNPVRIANVTNPGTW